MCTENSLNKFIYNLPIIWAKRFALRNSVWLHQGIKFRLLNEHDSITEITKLLHDAYSIHSKQGFNFLATNQDTRLTKNRFKKAINILAFEENKIVGCISYKPPHVTKGSPWYKLSKFNQLAVSPEYQNRGIAAKLLAITECLAKLDHASELALDTAEEAENLILYYNRKGFRFIEYIQWPRTNYRSVVLSKSIM
jgi:GNAT superfamily N-acetyltransferase